MSYDLAKLPIHSLLRPISEAAVALARCGFYFPISIEALS
jgi:hypothetical protein